MNKLIYLLLVSCLLLTCKKETPTTRYKVVNNWKPYEWPSNPSRNGTVYSVVVYAYQGSTVIGQESLGNIGPNGGYTPEIEVNSKATSVRASYLIVPLSQYANQRYYTVAKITLKAGGLTTVILSDTTAVSLILPTE